jgi:hypothetical protein
MITKFVLLMRMRGANKSDIPSLLGQKSLADFVNFDVDGIVALLPLFYHVMVKRRRVNEHAARCWPAAALRGRATS